MRWSACARLGERRARGGMVRRRSSDLLRASRRRRNGPAWLAMDVMLAGVRWAGTDAHASHVIPPFVAATRALEVQRHPFGGAFGHVHRFTMLAFGTLDVGGAWTRRIRTVVLCTSVPTWVFARSTTSSSASALSFYRRARPRHRSFGGLHARPTHQQHDGLFRFGVGELVSIHAS